MEATSRNFRSNTKHALIDANLQKAMRNVPRGFVQKRIKARDALPEFDQLRDEASAIKEHVLAHLDLYLERFEAKVIENGGQVHWAAHAEDARAIISDICKQHDAKSVTKGKSMITEEISLNDHLEENNITVVETDLGEYIIQLRNEHPSHIIAPAIHLNKEQVEQDFRRVHKGFDQNRELEHPPQLVAEAREVLRQKFLAADIGITGANLLIAETGTSVIVTNEGNGDLTQTLPKAHIVVASIEKIVPTLEDADTILRILARSATGQDASTYTTFSTGPKRTEDPDGPQQYHVILLDNGRSEMIGSDFQDMLKCIRCGACLNHCPVYHQIGGHAYGWVYPGPMGAVLTPSLIGIDEAGHLPNASSFCGRCEAVCPVRIPLPKMMRHWREREYDKGNTPYMIWQGLRGWSYLSAHPKLYQFVMRPAIALMSWFARKQGYFTKLPFGSGWTDHRNFPSPEGKTFQQLWREQQEQ